MCGLDDDNGDVFSSSPSATSNQRTDSQSNNTNEDRKTDKNKTEKSKKEKTKDSAKGNQDQGKNYFFHNHGKLTKEPTIENRHFHTTHSSVSRGEESDVIVEPCVHSLVAANTFDDNERESNLFTSIPISNRSNFIEPKAAGTTAL